MFFFYEIEKTMKDIKDLDLYLIFNFFPFLFFIFIFINIIFLNFYMIATFFDRFINNVLKFFF